MRDTLHKRIARLEGTFGAFGAPSGVPLTIAAVLDGTANIADVRRLVAAVADRTRGIPNTVSGLR